MKIILLNILLLVAILSVNCRPNSAKTEQQAAISEPSISSPAKDIKTIGILLYDGYSTLDAMGPYQVLSELMGTEVFFVAKERGLVSNSSGMQVKVEKSFADVDSLDILLIPGGFKETYELQQDQDLLNWVKKIDRTTTYTTSVCTGAWVLGATGLLKGKNATTHWYGKKILREMGVNVLDQRWVQDGKYWTSAGVTAGMDMSLAIVNDIMGEKYTKGAMLDLEYDPQPPFKAGSEQNTDKEIVDMMRTMYDGGLAGAINKVKKQSTAAQTTSEKRTQKPAPTAPSTPPQNQIENKVDFICGMKVTPEFTDTCVYKGKAYAFCSEYCKEAFLEKPEKYLKKK